jgi:hypothetical protein
MAKYLINIANTMKTMSDKKLDDTLSEIEILGKCLRIEKKERDRVEYASAVEAFCDSLLGKTFIDLAVVPISQTLLLKRFVSKKPVRTREGILMFNMNYERVALPLTQLSGEIKLNLPLPKAETTEEMNERSRILSDCVIKEDSFDLSFNPIPKPEEYTQHDVLVGDYRDLQDKYGDFYVPLPIRLSIAESCRLQHLKEIPAFYFEEAKNEILDLKEQALRFSARLSSKLRDIDWRLEGLPKTDVAVAGLQRITQEKAYIEVKKKEKV